MGLSILGNLLNASATLAATQMTNNANADAIAATNAANLAGIRDTNKTNAANVAATNAANLEQVRLTNAANLEQANLAYQRSLPVNQVRDLMDAGMSKAGALNKLAGGGVYTPPALQAGTSQASTSQAAQSIAPHFDYSGIAQAAERVASIPANQVQLEYNKEQINALREDLRLKREAEKREQQKHEFDMWKEQYGKDTATILDSASSRVADVLLQSGKEIGDFKSFEDLIRGLNLQDDQDIKRMPHLARVQLEDSIRSKFSELRSQRDQEIEERAAEIRNRIDKQTLADMKAHAAEYKKSANLRDKKRKNDELQEDVRAIALQMDYDLKELDRDFKFTKDKDGRTIVTPHEGISQVANEFWHTVGSVIGLNYVGDILKGLIAVGAK